MDTHLCIHVNTYILTYGAITTLLRDRQFVGSSLLRQLLLRAWYLHSINIGTNCCFRHCSFSICNMKFYALFGFVLALLAMAFANPNPNPEPLPGGGGGGGGGGGLNLELGGGGGGGGGGGK
ncbi:PREDICTED: uncharacterized protein LOC108365348 [Rhagoletis zephyria]|uniref:uncharacterized protein LOC108365348 n=2 Tax=Trypetinae TaxID=43867 RepID=UPI00081120C2|nr:PREDICTED: uncharacterized protein LOC108365348 [Rhagoletis zephyria]XP_036338662.1 uncharacterized protein LOC118748397 [Rhagoletis pomonella]